MAEVEAERREGAAVDLDRDARAPVGPDHHLVGTLGQQAGAEHRGDGAVDGGAAEAGTPRELVAEIGPNARVCSIT